MIERKKEVRIVSLARSDKGVVRADLVLHTPASSLEKSFLIPPPAYLQTDRLILPYGPPDQGLVHRVPLVDLLNGGGSIRQRKLIEAFGIECVQPDRMPRGSGRWVQIHSLRG